jgi:hypothetical protein
MADSDPLPFSNALWHCGIAFSNAKWVHGAFLLTSVTTVI